MITFVIQVGNFSIEIPGGTYLGPQVDNQAYAAAVDETGHAIAQGLGGTYLYHEEKE